MPCRPPVCIVTHRQIHQPRRPAPSAEDDTQIVVRDGRRKSSCVMLVPPYVNFCWHSSRCSRPQAANKKTVPLRPRSNFQVQRPRSTRRCCRPSSASISLFDPQVTSQALSDASHAHTVHMKGESCTIASSWHLVDRRNSYKQYARIFTAMGHEKTVNAL